MSYNDFLASLNRTYGAPEPVRSSEGGVMSDMARSTGSMVQGVGTGLRDLGAQRLGLALEEYGRGVQERNPSSINTLQDVLDRPGTTLREVVAENVPTLAAIAGGARAGVMAGGRFGAKGAAVGGLIGGLAAPFAQSYGGIRETQQRTDSESIPTALAGAAASSVVERFVGPERFVGRAASGMVRPGEGFAARVGRNTALGAAGEGAVEPIQTAIERAAGGESLTNDAAVDDYILSSVKGAIGGGAIRGGMSAFRRGVTEEPPPAPVGSQPTDLLRGNQPGQTEAGNAAVSNSVQNALQTGTMADLAGPAPVNRVGAAASPAAPAARTGTMADLAGGAVVNQGNAPASMADFYAGDVLGVDDPYVGMRGGPAPRRNLGLPVGDPMAGYRGESGEVEPGTQLDMFEQQGFSPAGQRTVGDAVSPSNQAAPIDLAGMEAGAESDPRQRTLGLDTPRDQGRAAFNPIGIRQRIEDAVGLRRRPDGGAADPYSLMVGLRLADLLQRDKSADAAKFLADEQAKLETAKLRGSTVDLRRALLSAAALEVEDYRRTMAATVGRAATEMAQNARGRAQPGAVTDFVTAEQFLSDTEQEMRRANARRGSAIVDTGPDLRQSVTEQEMRERNAATRQPIVANTRATDPNEVVENERRERSARERLGILQSVLDDPQTVNPIGRFRAELRRAGFRDTGLTAEEASTIDRFEQARSAEPAAQDRSGVEALEAQIPERRPKGSPPAPRVKPVPQVQQPRRPVLVTEAREELDVPPEARPEAAPAQDEGTIADARQASMFAGSTRAFTRTATGETRAQLLAEADRLLASIPGAKSKEVMGVAIRAFAKREVEMSFVRDVAEALKARKFGLAKTLVQPFEQNEAAQAQPVVGNPVGPMPQPTGNLEFDTAAMNRWRAENVRNAEEGITWQDNQAAATPQDVEAQTPPATPAANTMRAAMEKAQLEKVQAEAELAKLQVEKAKAEAQPAAASAPTREQRSEARRTLRDRVEMAAQAGLLTPQEAQDAYRLLLREEPQAMQMVQTMLNERVAQARAERRASQAPSLTGDIDQTEQTSAPATTGNIGSEIGEALRANTITATQSRYLRTLMMEDGEDAARAQLEEYKRLATGSRPEVTGVPLDRDRTVLTGRGSARADEGTADEGPTLSVQDVQRVVAEKTQGWRQAPQIQVVASVEELPTEVRSDLEGRGYSRFFGLYDREAGTVYLIANRLRTPDQVSATLYHESLGHFGLTRALGSRLQDVLGMIYRTNPEMRRYADDYIARFPDAFPDAATRGAFAVEEVLASAAESGQRIPQSVFDRISAVIKQFARRMGLFSGDYSNAEVAAILNQAMSQVERPGPGPGRGSRDQTRQRLEPTMARGEETNIASMSGMRSMLAGRQGIVTDITEKGRIARLATLFGNQIEDLYGKMLPQLKTYNAFQGKAAARISTVADKARDYLDRWDRLGAHQGMTAAQVQKEVGDLLLDSTFNQMRPDLPLTDDVNSEVTTDEAKAKYAALQQRYNKLSPAGQKVYKDILGQYKENLDEKRRLFLAQSDKLGQDGLNDNNVQELKRDIERFFKQIKVYFPLSRFGDYVVVARKPEYDEINEQTQAAYQRVEDLQNGGASEQDVKAARQEASDLAARRRKVAESGYIVQAFDKLSEQQAAVKRYAGAGYNVQPLRANQYQPEIDGVSSRFLDRMKQALAVEAERGGPGSPREIIAKQFSNLLQQTYFQSLPEHHALKSSMRRDYVEGFSRDARRAFASSMLRDGHYLARLEFAQQTQDTLEEMRLEARKADEAATRKNPNSPMMAQAVYEEVAKRHASALRYVETPVSDALANMGYIWFLGFTPSFMLMNMMQTPMVTMPMVAARFGLGRTGGALTKAMQEAGTAQSKAWQRDGRFGEVKPEDLTTDPAERSAIQELMNRGTIDLTQEHDLGAVATGRSTGWQKMMRYASYLPHYTEKFNRIATALASYRLAMDGFERTAATPGSRSPVPMASDAEYGSYAKGHIEEQQRLLEAGRISAATPPLTIQQFSAMRFAQKMVNDSHFDYSAENAPRWMRPSVFPLSKVMFQFKKYQVAMGYAVVNNAYQMLKNADPQERAIARRTFFGLLATHGIMAGSLGLPGVGAAIFMANLVSSLFGDEDEPWNAEVAYRTFLVDAMAGFTDDPQLRRQLGEMVSRGVLRAPGVRDALPGDISQRVGLGDLFSPVRLRQGDNTGRDKWNEIMASLFGPASSIGGDYFEAVRLFQANQPEKAVEMMMPKVIRDMLRAGRFASEGVTTTRGNVVMSPDKISDGDIIAQLFGFTPSRIMESYEARSAIEGARRQVTSRRQSLLKSYSEAVIAGDQEELAEVRADIARFNRIRRENREPIIQGQDLLRSVQERRRYERELNSGVRLRRNEQSFARYGAFANTD